MTSRECWHKMVMQRKVPGTGTRIVTGRASQGMWGKDLGAFGENRKLGQIRSPQPLGVTGLGVRGQLGVLDF